MGLRGAWPHCQGDCSHVSSLCDVCPKAHPWRCIFGDTSKGSLRIGVFPLNHWNVQWDAHLNAPDKVGEHQPGCPNSKVFLSSPNTCLPVSSLHTHSQKGSKVLKCCQLFKRGSEIRILSRKNLAHRSPHHISKQVLVFSMNSHTTAWRKSSMGHLYREDDYRHLWIQDGLIRSNWSHGSDCPHVDASTVV